MFAGRIQPLKAPDVLLRAVPRCSSGTRRCGRRLVVPVVGGPSGTGLEHPESLAQLAASLGIADVVRFVPPVAQSVLADWYAAATLVCVPSYNESFGLVAVEAQAAGTPVVAAAVGGLTTVVRDGRSGLLVEGHDPVDYARAMERIVHAPDLRAELSPGRWPRRPASRGSAPRTAPSRSTGPRRSRCATTWPGRARDPARGRPRHGPQHARRVRPDLVRRSARGCSPSCCPARRSSQTPVRLDVGEHALGVHAFVARHPDENHERVYRWLLERNLKMFGVALRGRPRSATSTSTAGCRWSRSPPTRSTGCSAPC